MRRRIVAAAGVAFVLIGFVAVVPLRLGAQQIQELSPDTVTQLEAEQASFRQGFIENYVAGNFEAIAELFAEDAHFAGTLQPFWLDGQEAIANLWQRFLRLFPLDV